MIHMLARRTGAKGRRSFWGMIRRWIVFLALFFGYVYERERFADDAVAVDAVSAPWERVLQVRISS